MRARKRIGRFSKNRPRDQLPSYAHVYPCRVRLYRLCGFANADFVSVSRALNAINGVRARVELPDAGIFNFRFAKNLASSASFGIHHATRVKFFLKLSLSLSVSRSLARSLARHRSTAIQIQTSLRPARVLIHTYDRARRCRAVCVKGLVAAQRVWPGRSMVCW